MKCFIVMDNADNKIIKVQDADVTAFRQEYGTRILIEGNSVQDLLIKLSERIQSNNENLPPELFR